MAEREPGHPGYLRYPAIRAGRLVFVCEDDLWAATTEGGQAVRLTTASGPVSGPRISPDGQTVAFTGTDDGPSEVYLQPLAGGMARRLTFQAARHCTVVGWHPGTGEILYASNAGQPPGQGPRLFAINPAGGLPRLLPYGLATAIAHGPDGQLVLGRNTADPARWKRYRGGTAGELWISKNGDDALFERLLVLPGNLAGPCWAADRVWFVADHEGVGNVYSCAPDGTGLTRHTDHRDFYARCLDSDGERLVYQTGAELMLLDPAGDGPRRIEPVLHRSGSRRRQRFVPAVDYLESASLSPDGGRSAVVVRGRLFTLGHWEGPVRSHGASDGVRYRLPAWMADGVRLVAAFADESAEEHLVVLDTSTAGPPQKPALPGLGRISALEASPVADTVAVANHRHELFRVDLPAAGRPTALRLDRSPYGPIADLAWSPDGRWLAYTLPTGPQTSTVKLADLVTGLTHQVTDPVLRDHSPCFDPKGRYLYFIGQRRLSSKPDQVAFGHGFRNASHPYVVTLHNEQPSPFVFRPGSPDLRAEAPESTAPEGHPGVDLDGITGRVAAFPVPPGDYLQVLGTPSGVLLFAADPGCDNGRLNRFDLAELELTEFLDDVSDPRTDTAGAVLLCRSGGRLRVVTSEREENEAGPDDSGEPGRGSGWIDLGRIQVPVRPQAEWRQMFREAWRLQRDYFWDAGMSGVDWDALYQHYLPLLDRVGSRAELSDVLWELQGELGTSHAYEFGGDYARGDLPGQGFLGVDWAPGPGVGTRIAEVLTGDPSTLATTVPVRRLGVDVRAGDRVTAVDGYPVGPEGPGPLLVGRAGQEVELTLRRDGRAEWRVCVRATDDEGPARYRDWVRRTRQSVLESSGGRVGYVHIPDMYAEGYAEFIRGFLADHDREALIVDVRFNPGGFSSPLVLDRLTRRRQGYEASRWSGAVPYPIESPRGPMVALVNEHTGSDGDVFAHLFRKLGLGPLVGRRTWGGVIAVSPRHRLVDGTLTTQPEYAYTFEDVGRSLENRGVEPDIVVDNDPNDHVMGRDAQVERAVRAALDELDGGAGPGRSRSW